MGARWNSADLAQKQPATPRKQSTRHTDTKEPEASRKAKETEPAEKQVTLPPPPADCGPWQVGEWTIRRTTTYAPAARMTATGPGEEFARFLAHIQAYQP